MPLALRAGWLGACLLASAPALATSPGRAASPGELCLSALALAEQAHRVPTHLLRSIAFVESGRTDPNTGRAVPWPWTINAAGRGMFFDTREEALAAVRDLQAAGVRSIDVGCAQVSLLHHPAAFASLEDAFDPGANTRYAARFLNALYATTRNWPLAAAAYHSQTQERGLNYARRVMAIWPNAASYGPLPDEAGTGAGVAARAATVNYALYTPAFAAALRRMEADQAAIRPAARAARGADSPSIWLNRPPAPVPLSGAGSLASSRRDARRGAG